MLHIGNFLSKTEQALELNESTQKEVSLILEKILNFKIKSEQITLHGSKIKLKISPLKKMHLLLHKQKVLEAIKLHPLLSEQIKDIN